MPARSEESLAEIGRRLRLIRLAYCRVQGKPNMSQAEFARLCGITPPSWNNSETGDARIGLDSALAVAQRIGVTLDYIYRGNPALIAHAIAEEIERLEAEESIKPARRA